MSCLRRRALANGRRATLLLAVALAALAADRAALGAHARAAAPTITALRCPTALGCADGVVRVRAGDVLHVEGRNLPRRVRVYFARRTASAPRPVRVGVRLSPRRLRVVVPSAAASGRIRLRAPGRPPSNLGGPLVVDGVRVGATELPAGPSSDRGPGGGAGRSPSLAAFDGNGMWIWYLDRAAGGSVAAIAARARRNGIATVFVKAGDGAAAWSQLSSALVRGLRARGLRVCAWQYVYGSRPLAEAAVGARAARLGADCLVIDAEAEYEGRYAPARTYLRRLRALVGSDYPLGFTSFPYVDYHPSMPYSVFLGPGGAQVNLPQMYWRAIGTTVDRVVERTYRTNGVYGRAIAPLGQLYDDPPPAEILRFRRLVGLRGATGTSWWDWQHASARGFAAAGTRLGSAATSTRPRPGYPKLRPGARGDLVVWAQQHLAAAGLPAGFDGHYHSATARAVRRFQARHRLARTGVLDGRTWRRLLDRRPTVPRWARPRHAGVEGASTAGGPSGPRSAQLPAVRDELDGRSNGRRRP